MTDAERKARVQARLDAIIESGTDTQFIECLPYLMAWLAPQAPVKGGREGGGHATAKLLVAADGSVEDITDAG